MRLFTYLGIALVVLWIARDPGVLFWMGFFGVAAFLFFHAFPEDKPEIKREKQEIRIKF